MQALEGTQMLSQDRIPGNTFHLQSRVALQKGECNFFLIGCFMTPNVMVEWLTLLLRFLEAPASNLGPVTNYLE
jgi:hypothetical protein